jgi:hypothetical protein
MSLLDELDPPCPRGCERTVDECDEAEDGGDCAGSPLVQELEHQMEKRARQIESRDRMIAELGASNARLIGEIDGLRARVAELETQLGPTKEAADRWLKAYEELLAERDRLKARAASQHLELGQLYPRISELTKERDEATARLKGSRQFVADEDERWRARVAQTEAVVQSAKAWREAESASPYLGVSPEARELIAAVDALDDPSGEAAKPGGNETGCDHWFHRLAIRRGESMSFTPDAYRDIEAHRLTCPIWAAGHAADEGEAAS